MTGFVGVRDSTIREIATEATRRHMRRRGLPAINAASVMLRCLREDFGVAEDRLPTREQVVAAFA